jgi:hypothetical protein
LPQFFSWMPDPKAIALDVLQQDWSYEKSYAFPPFCLIMWSLAKLRAQGAELILVTPLGPTQAWYPNLLNLSVSLPVLLPMSPSLLLGGRYTLWLRRKTFTLNTLSWLWHVFGTIRPVYALAVRVTSQIATRFRLWRQEVSYPVILQSMHKLTRYQGPVV